MLVVNIDSSFAIYNWVEYEGYVYDDDGGKLQGATVWLYIEDTTTDVDSDITDSNGYYYIKEYVDATDRFDLTAEVNDNWTDYTYDSVLGRAEAEPWRYDFNLYFVETYALIVGINVYEELDELDYCVNDANAWYNHLTDSSGLDFDDVVKKTNSQAEESEIKDELTTMVSKADQGDIIAFIFSGHGWDDDDGSNYSLSMYDSDSGNNGEDGELYDDELAEILQDSEAERIFLFFDSCHSYGMKEDLDDMTNADTVFLAAAADESETAYEDTTNYLSCWTECFLEYSWKFFYSSSITTSFNLIYNKAVWAYDSVYLSQSIDHYNDNQNPQKWNDYGSSFCLSYEGII